MPRHGLGVQRLGHLRQAVAGHRPGVAEAEVDVVEAVDIGEVGTVGRVEEERERARPAGHPRHRHAAEQVGLGLFGKHCRARMGGDEALLFLGVAGGENLSINHEHSIHDGIARCQAEFDNLASHGLASRTVWQSAVGEGQRQRAEADDRHEAAPGRLSSVTSPSQPSRASRKMLVNGLIRATECSHPVITFSGDCALVRKMRVEERQLHQCRGAHVAEAIGRAETPAGRDGGDAEPGDVQRDQAEQPSVRRAPNSEADDQRCR